MQREIDVRICDPSQVVRVAKQNDLAIFYSEHFHRFRDAWLQLSKKGCNTLYAIDGILEWRNAWENRDDEPACPWTMRPVLSDKVACIGNTQSRVIDSWGNQGKTEVVGIPRLESLRNGGTSQREPDDVFRVLVMTAKWPGFTPKQIDQVTQSLIDLRDHFERNPLIHGRTVAIQWRLTGQLDKAIGVDNQLDNLHGQELEVVLREVDAVITTPSTVMLESMLCGLPVCLLDYTNSPRYVQAAWSITARDQMADEIVKLARASDRRMFLQQSILEESLQCRQDATKRLARLASEMIRIGHDLRASSQPVSFPERILDPVASQLAFDPGLIFPDQSLNTQTGKQVQYMAVAAESLRRVNDLQSRIELLENELEKAADGFDRIASHPILAPLVKVRKIAMSMGGRISDVLSAGDRKKNNTPTRKTSNIEVKT